MDISNIKSILVKSINTLAKFEIENSNSIIEELQFLLENLIAYFGSVIKFKPKIKTRKIILGEIDDEYGINFAVKRDEDQVILADWLFTGTKTRNIDYYLSFILLKEAVLHFTNKMLSDIDFAVINICIILLFKEIYGFDSLDSTHYKVISHRIYSSDISGISMNSFVALSTILFIKDISFKETFTHFINDIHKDTLSEKEKYQQFARWVNSHIKELDVLAPIYISHKKIKTLYAVMELGSEESKTDLIAERLDLHPNSIRRHLHTTLANASIFWRAYLNLGLLKLYNYFIKVELADKGNLLDINNLIWQTPYIKSIFTGYEDSKTILYSPTLICPHLVADNLNQKFLKLKKDGIITDFNLARIYEKRHYGAITTKRLNPDVNFFKKSLQGKNSNIIQPKIFAQEKEDFKMEFDDDDKRLDYNLLFFLSIIRGKYLTKKSYNVVTSELPKLYEKNDIDISEYDKQIDFLNQIEIRARRRRFLSYAFFMRSYTPRGSDVFTIEIQNMNNLQEEIKNDVLSKIQVFSCIGQIDIPNHLILTIPGINHKHEVANLIKKFLSKYSLDAKFYTIQLAQKKLIPLYDLYDYDKQTWKIS